MNPEKKESKKSSNSNNKGGYRLQSLLVKREAVAEYEAKETPLQEIIKKYNISIGTLFNWRKQVKKGHDPLIRQMRYPIELKKRVVRAVVTGEFTIKEAAAHYGIGKDITVEAWCSKYSCQIESISKNDMASDKVSGSDEQKEILKLQEALKEANLKIMGLETMIDIAESNLKVDIRKKSGTKQSKQ